MGTMHLVGRIGLSDSGFYFRQRPCLLYDFSETASLTAAFGAWLVACAPDAGLAWLALALAWTVCDVLCGFLLAKPLLRPGHCPELLPLGHPRRDYAAKPWMISDAQGRPIRSFASFAHSLTDQPSAPLWPGAGAMPHPITAANPPLGGAAPLRANFTVVWGWNFRVQRLVVAAALVECTHGPTYLTISAIGAWILSHTCLPYVDAHRRTLVRHPWTLFPWLFASACDAAWCLAPALGLLRHDPAAWRACVWLVCAVSLIVNGVNTWWPTESALRARLRVTMRGSLIAQRWPAALLCSVMAWTVRLPRV
jgi:hypothetical protein